MGDSNRLQDMVSPMRTLLRPPLRALAAHRGATLIALLTLALTIGLSTAVFSIVNGVVLRPLPFRDHTIRIAKR
jgi:hypothetical protein